MKLQKFNQLMEKNVVIFDGAMGTELQKAGLKAGQPSELFNFDEPEVVAEIIRSYAKAGSEIISTNTFCANRYKLNVLGKSIEETIVRAVEISQSALRDDYPHVLIAQDIGPIGQLLRPTGTLDFKDAYEIFAEAVKAGVKSGADLFVLQTFSDLLELKAGLLAVKENSDLPVICSMTFETNGRTFTGCPVSAAAVTLTGLGANAIGINCSYGPNELLPVVRELQKWTELPLMIKPNAGLPDPVTGKFKMTAEQFADDMCQYSEMGIKILGGCCGTSPEFIKMLLNRCGNLKANDTSGKRAIHTGAVCSGTKTIAIDQPRVIGERINPTGKRLFKEALKSSDIDYILGQAIEQARAGADILDVNVGLPEIDEKSVMLRVIELLQSVCDLPLQIDSASPDVLEAALRRYNGKPIVNSVNGKEESLCAVLPLVKKYGAAVIGLTLDENGIPETAEKRLEIAKRIMERALSLGIKKEDIIIDCLTLTVSTEPHAAEITLEAVGLVKKTLGLKTALGVSNVSFGLPSRELINSAFLTSALQRGLDLPIINPNATSVMGAVRAYKLLAAYDKNAGDYISAYADKPITAPTVKETTLSLSEAVSGGMKKDGAQITKRLLKDICPMKIINGLLIPALDKVGDDFEKGVIFLPQLILAAETAGECFDVIKKRMSQDDMQGGDRPQIASPRKILLATVKGDIHDIGKNIVKVLLENYGYEIIDLGRDVSPESIVDTAVEKKVELIGLSALMTTTLNSMAQTITLLKERDYKCPVMVGGAVLNSEYAAKIGADYYAKDAKGAVDIAKRVFNR